MIVLFNKIVDYIWRKPVFIYAISVLHWWLRWTCWKLWKSWSYVHCCRTLW